LSFVSTKIQTSRSVIYLALKLCKRTPEDVTVLPKHGAETKDYTTVYVVFVYIWFSRRK
jgi:hypothetical protein